MKWGVLGMVLVSAAAQATPHPLPFTYPTDQLPKGAIEVEQYVDLTPVRIDDGSKPSFAPLTQFTTEVEIGLTDQLELGLYFAFFDDLTAFHWDAIKQRIRFRPLEPGQWPIDIGFYLELAEEFDAFEIEAKILLQRRFGPLLIDVNLWAEREFFWAGGGVWVLNPTAGVTYAVRPWFNIGVEYWGHGEFGGENPGFNEDFHSFLGPAFMVQSGNFWWTVAPYIRLDGFDRGAKPGDQFGRVWIRSVLGLNI